MKNNKLICVLLTLLVCLSMVVSASATTESDLSFTLESDSSVEALDAAVVGAGETFTVDVVINSNPGIKLAIAMVDFNAEVVELVSAESVADDVTTRVMSGRIHINVGDTSAVFGTDKVCNTTGVVAKLTFKVLVETDEQTAIELKASQGNTMDANGKFGEITVSGDVLNVNVVSADHTCDETKTVEANNAVEPTCTETGKTTDLLCAHCGKTLTEGEEIPATDHNWEASVGTAPTCGEHGEEILTCTVCGETKVGQQIPATGEHTFGEWTEKTPATTEAEGVEARTCSVCGAEETRPIEKLSAPEEPAPKNNTLLIVIIVVVVLAGAGVAAYFVLKNKKK